MRTFIITTFFCFTGLFVSTILGDTVPTGDNWNPPRGGLRSSIPTPPIASVEGNVVFIYFVDALSDLTVSITDAHGSIVYQKVISSNGYDDYTYELDWRGQPGDYQLLMTHEHGYLGGAFQVR